MFKPLSKGVYACVARNRYPYHDPEFQKLDIHEKTGGYHNPQNNPNVYLGAAQSKSLREKLKDTEVNVTRRSDGLNVQVVGLNEPITGSFYNLSPEFLCEDALHPETPEGRLYLREEFAHIKVPTKLGRKPVRVAEKIFNGLFLHPQSLEFFPEFGQHYCVAETGLGQGLALKSGCSQTPISSPLFEVYYGFHPRRYIKDAEGREREIPQGWGMNVVPIDRRAELILTTLNLEALAS